VDSGSTKRNVALSKVTDDLYDRSSSHEPKQINMLYRSDVLYWDVESHKITIVWAEE
jgi:hypothetical protein